MCWPRRQSAVAASAGWTIFVPFGGPGGLAVFAHGNLAGDPVAFHRARKRVGNALALDLERRLEAQLVGSHVAVQFGRIELAVVRAHQFSSILFEGQRVDGGAASEL